MKIIGISGRKQAGKNTVANYINGDILKQKGMVREFFINDDGQLIVETSSENGEYGYGQFDVTRKDEAFVTYAYKELWPYIKVYHFADPLKKMSIDLFDLEPNLIYGNNDDKNTKTDLLWQNMPDNLSNKSGKMTIREFLEHFGTNVIRKIKNDAWVSFTINSLLLENPEIAIIPDVRFPNEVEAIKNAGGINIRLTRDIYNSTSDSESALDKNKFDWDNFDLVIDNSELSLQDLCAFLSNNTSLWR